MKDSEGNEFVMLFGDSYKKYLRQVQEFFYRNQKWINRLPHPCYEMIEFSFSKSKWKAWAGLKWCEEKDFQEELNREGVQSNEPDNPNPRQYSDMVFSKNRYREKQLKEFFKIQYRGRSLVKDIVTV